MFPHCIAGSSLVFVTSTGVDNLTISLFQLVDVLVKITRHKLCFVNDDDDEMIDAVNVGQLMSG